MSMLHQINALNLKGIWVAECNSRKKAPIEKGWSGDKKFCAVLDCTLDDIVEFSEDDAEYSGRGKQNG